MSRKAACPADPVVAATIGEVAGELSDHLRVAGVHDPRREAALLLDRVGGIDREQVLLAPDRPLTTDQRKVLAAGLARRIAHEPVSRIAGWTEFYGRRFRVTPDVLDPRADTETLVDLALRQRGRWMPQTGTDPGAGEPAKVLDVGTGSGCLLATLVAEIPGLTGVGIDISEAACAVARDNVAALGLAGRATVICHDADTPLNAGPFNLIVSNPPYIALGERSALAREVVNHDPEMALFAGADGLACYRAWFGWIPRALAPGGCVVVEIGWRQAADVSKLVREAFAPSQNVCIEVVTDLAGRDRCVAAWTRW